MHTTASEQTKIETGDRERIQALIQQEIKRAPASIERVEAGLGTRRFYRIQLAEGLPASLIARIEPQSSETRDHYDHYENPDPDSEENSGRDALAPGSLPDAPTSLTEPKLEPIRQFLEDGGLRVPHGFAHLPEQGIDLLEDVGRRTLMDATGAKRDVLYSEACQMIPKMQGLTSTANQIPAFGRHFDRALVDTKAWKWLHWTLPGLLNREATEAEAHSIHALFGEFATLFESAPQRLAHRDFKAENLHLVSTHDSSGAEELVMIDVQGAFMAPPEYDLVCLLYDLQMDLDEEFAMACFDELRPYLADSMHEDVVKLRFDAIATVRLCKDISHLVYAAKARRDPRRWHEIPRGLALLTRATGRLSRTFPKIRELTSVIQALTLAFSSSDSGRVTYAGRSIMVDQISDSAREPNGLP